MKNLIVVFIILPLFGLSQKQFPSIVSERQAQIVNDMPKGNVKFTTTRGKELSMDSILWNKIDYYTFLERAELNGKEDSVIFDKKRNIKAFFTLWCNSGERDYFFSYDSLSRLVEIIKGINSRETFKYDKDGNCTQWRSFYNKNIQDGFVKNEYKGNLVTSYYYQSDTVDKNKWYEKTITSIENNKKSTINYSNGRKTYERLEIQKGDTTFVNFIDYNIKGIADTTTNVTILNKVNKIERTKVLCDLEVITETTFNDNGDIIIYNNKKYTQNKLTSEYVKTYKYEYDSKGNYIKKTICWGDIPILEITRNIGYY